MISQKLNIFKHPFPYIQKMVAQNIQFKAEYFTGLAGVILGMIATINGILAYLFEDQLDGSIFREISIKLVSGLDVISLGGFISSVIGLGLGIALIFVLTKKIAKSPSQSDFIAFTVLGGIALFTTFGVGGLLALVAGIIGLIRVQK